ncbi:MAG: hypothetical protein ACJAYB_002303 [Psychromonas sp.]|jgi:hypothetical protein
MEKGRFTALFCVFNKAVYGLVRKDLNIVLEIQV